MKMENNTHARFPKGKKSPLSPVGPKHLCLFFLSGCSISACITSIRAGLRGQSEGFLREVQSDRSGSGLRPTSLKHICMQMSTHSRAGEARMNYKGINYFSLFNNTQ